MSNLPHGFRRMTTSDLLVPEAQSRQREVWTETERRLLDRLTKLLNTRGLMLVLGCTDPGCKDAPIERVANPDGGFSLQCAHKSRVFVRRD